MFKMKLLIFIVLLVGTCQGLNNGLALTPQMGWNSWNFYSCQVNESVIREAADAMVYSGLSQLGYEYINIDDCWAHSRDNNGRIVADPFTFPSGIKALADYVHSKGLKFGIYSDSGEKTCAGRPGSLGYETLDAESYASWGVDYLKFDNCNAPADQTPKERYPIMTAALNATGRKILFSMCDWGVQDPWIWAQNVGNSWRTDNDISSNWDSFIRVLDNQIGLSIFAGPGAWNDADMLEVGNPGMNYHEYRSHFALWCLLKSPLLIGCDMTSMSEETKEILGTVELLAVSQDSLGVQGDLIWQLGPAQIWATLLSDGSRVFILFNRHTVYTTYNNTITIKFEDLGFQNGTYGIVRDLYARQDIGKFQDYFSVSIMTHDVFAGKFTPLNVKEIDIKWRPKLRN